MTDALAAAGRRAIRYRRIEIEQIAQPSTDLAAMCRFLERTGYQVDICALRDRFPEVPWTSFADWAQRQAHPSG
jgi:hypothetical protein